MSDMFDIRLADKRQGHCITLELYFQVKAAQAIYYKIKSIIIQEI